ncbi:hypothetical protein F5X97DRAFT_326902 [Nemania serpens]|nr:hypothetical protein F5X97DRAFT_326902 [Nemania serpens]
MPPARNHTQRAKNRDSGKRDAATIIKGALVCRPCFGRIHAGFQPKKGQPLEVGCSMKNPGSSSCEGCEGCRGGQIFASLKGRSSGQVFVLVGLVFFSGFAGVLKGPYEGVFLADHIVILSVALEGPRQRS